MGEVISFDSERVSRYLEASFKLFLSDPPDSSFQQGFLACQLTLYKECLGKGVDDAQIELLEGMVSQETGE